jgi:hypothetical protein
MTNRAAYRRKERGAGQAWDVYAVLCAVLWLVCAAGFAGLALKAGTEYAYRPDMRLLLATWDLPAYIEPLLRAQALLTAPLTLAGGIFGLATLLIVRRAKAESLVVLAALALFGITAVSQQVVHGLHPGFRDFAPYERLLAGNYFPSGQVAGVAVLAGLVFAFAERLQSDVLDAWFLRLAASGVFAGIGPLQIYLGVQVIDVVGAYLLVAMFLLPVVYAYGRAAGTEDEAAYAVDTVLPSNPAYFALFD